MASEGLKPPEAPLLPPICLRRVFPAAVVLLTAVVLLIAGCSMGKVGNGDHGRSLSPLNGLLALYRGPLDHLSAVRHGECPMFPSCSEYAREAVEKHGELVGWMMANDRLMRCGRDETRLSPRVKINGRWRYDDPVDRNDFWWHDTAPLSLGHDPRP